MNDCIRDLKGLRCIVMGGGGFMGTNLCLELARRGARVQAFDRACAMMPACEHVTRLNGDFGDPLAISRAIIGNDVVFHLVGTSLPASSNADPIADLKTGAINTLKMLDICRMSGVKRVIFASSGGTVYGVPQSFPIREDHPTEPICAYGISKLAIEKYLALYKHLYGLDFIALRIANPYGPYQVAAKQQGVVAAMLARALNGTPFEFWGTGSIVRDFVHVADVVEAMIASIFYEGQFRVFNVGSGIGRSIDEVATDIEHLFVDPKKVRRIYREARCSDVPVNILDIGLVKREMNWSPKVEWQEGLKDTADWMRNFMEADLAGSVITAAG